MRTGEAKDPPSGRPKALGRVLVVDDSPEIRRLYIRSLTRAGYQVTDAAGGRAALSLVREQAYDVVISDVQMPDWSGLDLLDALAHEEPLLPVVLVSGSPDLELAATVCGAFDYLIKPIAFEDLIDIVTQAVQQHRNPETVERGQPRHSTSRLRAAPVSTPGSELDPLLVQPRKGVR